MITKQQIINFFKSKPVRLFLFFIIIAGIMTGVSFAIMELVKAMGPKCGKGQTTIEGQDGCFNESCINKHCPIEGMGINYSSGPECPCSTKCPEGFAVTYNTLLEKKACEKKCGQSIKSNNNDICVYYEPLISGNKINYLNTDTYVNESIPNLGICYKDDQTKWANGPDGLFPVVCNNPDNCDTNSVNEPYCKSGATTGTICSGDKKKGCIPGSNCSGGGTCTPVVGNSSGVGVCADSISNTGVCCKPTLLSLDKKSNITCCKTTETPIINDKNAPSGCCPNTNLTADKKTCCLSSSQIVGNECCESSKQITIDGKKLCCTGHNILISDAYTIGSITGEEICTEYNGDATFKETAYNAATNSEDCYNIYKKLKSGDLPNFSYIYYNHYNSQCMLGCNKLNSDDHFEPANNLLLTSTSSGPSCKTNICSSDTPVYDPPTSSGNNFIFEDKNGIEYWTKPANINASTLTYKVQKTVTNPDNGDCNQSIGNNEACEEVLGNGFETEDYDTGNTTCTGTLMSTNFKTMICNNSLTPTTDYWINGVYPISFNESNSTYSCTNIAPKWNGQKWDPPTLKCSQANNCQFLSNGKYCINGSYDGKTCLQTTVTTTSACREFSGSLSSLSSYIKCTNPDGDTRTSPIYYCGSYSTDPTDPIKGFDPICTGNGIINQNEPYTVTCKGYFNLDSYLTYLLLLIGLVVLVIA